MMDDADLQLDWLRLSRKRDPATSHAAAKRIAPRLSALQARVLAWIGAKPGCTAREVETLGDFAAFAPSTVRKRITELHRKGLIVSAGIRNGMQTWKISR